jgi:hypothetical protein
VKKMLENFYNDTPKIIGFLICIIILVAVAGQKMTVSLLAIILLGQIIKNPSILKKIPFFGGNV